MSKADSSSVHERWAQFRFSVVGPLLSSPPAEGELSTRIQELAAISWVHPIDGEPWKIGESTIERWYYQAKGAGVDVVKRLRRKVRKDVGDHPSLPDAQRAMVHAQHAEHGNWSYQLHYDNLVARIAESDNVGEVPSYTTVRRYMKGAGLRKRRRAGAVQTDGAQRAAARLAGWEVRSFESEHVNALWHLDFHVCSRTVLTSSGRWEKPELLSVLDDRSRLCCHLQWYGAETAENLTHGLRQAFLKRQIPRALMMDNGAAMVAAETVTGLKRLGIAPQFTLPHSPYQNGKQESFWGQVEGRLMSMMQSCTDLTLTQLNDATQAWVELEYNRKEHSETHQAPVVRYLAGPDLGRAAPSSEELRLAFRRQERRSQRRSDGTVLIESVRFEIPSQYRQLERLSVRYARWDLGMVHLVDEVNDTVLCRLFPLNLAQNADGLRRTLPEPTSPTTPVPKTGMAPLLKHLLAQYAATGLPPAYLPKDEIATDETEEQR